MPSNSKRYIVLRSIQTIHTSNLEVGQFIVLTGVLETPQPNQIYVKLVGTALQLTNLQPRVYCSDA
jgi:hypothetical protein